MIAIVDRLLPKWVWKKTQDCFPKLFEDYLKTYPLEGCDTFTQSMDIQYVDGLDVFQEGIDVYNSFRKKCGNKDTVIFKDREKAKLIEIQCLHQVPIIEPYLRFEAKRQNL